MSLLLKKKFLTLLKSSSKTSNNSEISSNNVLTTQRTKSPSKTTIASKHLDDKKITLREAGRDTRHYAPANKEWKNSVYSYNKNSLYSMAAKDKIAGTIIKTYFNQAPVPFIIKRSRRVRNKLRRLSTKQLFVSKPEIKQTNDKAIVTVYTYDRQKKLYFKRLFMLRRWLNKNIFNSRLSNKTRANYTIYARMFKNKLMGKRRIKASIKKFWGFRKKRYIRARRISRYRVKSDLYRKTALMLIKKQNFLINVFLYSFLVRVFRLIFDLRVRIVPTFVSYITKRVFVKKKQQITIKGKWINKTGIWELKKIPLQHVKLVIDRKETKRQKKQRHIYNRENEIKMKRIEPYSTTFNFSEKSYLNLQLVKFINNLMLYWILSKYKSLPVNKFYKIFNKFKRNIQKKFIKQHLKRELLTIRYISGLYINRYKFNSYLPALKSFLSKVYDKKIQLNLVNLKYLQLNSEMFTEVLSIKLRKRTASLIKVLGKSFNLLKTFKPKDKYITLQKQKNFPIREVNTYFGKYNVINGTIINTVFNKMFMLRAALNSKNKSITTLTEISKNKRSITKNPISKKQNWKTTIKGVLKSIKYKWITGARIEAKGRLTKRYSASRALFKYKHRGSLRNLEYLRNKENDLQSPSVHMLRGDKRPNIQYSLTHSKRRIGAFGIKGWISNS